VEIRDDENKRIETVDAVGGLKVEIWTSDFQHALEGHPEVTLDRIRQALESPGQVIESQKSNRVCLFYSIGVKDREFGLIYFCVVVGVVRAGKGKLETAYETSYIKNGKVLFKKGGPK